LAIQIKPDYIIAPMRRLYETWPINVKSILIDNISPSTDWGAILMGASVVVHCAARVHVMNDKTADSMAAFQLVNVEGTLNLARQAAEAGVRRFVFVSSIKVNGEVTEFGRPFLADDIPAPFDPYGMSKLQAEEGLIRISQEKGMEVVIVRPPLVYGSGVKANFESLLKLVASGMPLPLGSIKNSRSLVALENLVDLLLVCIRHPEAAGHVFLVSDGEDISTTDLLKKIAVLMGKKSKLIPMQPRWLESLAFLIGKRAVLQRLCSNLQVDIEKTRQILGWEPILTLEQGLKNTIKGMRQ
jgi:UDP-glucose 4-epimerase